MPIVYEKHGCEPPCGGNYMPGTVWRCDDCSRGWFRNSNHAQNIYPLWSPVMPWQLVKRRLLAALSEEGSKHDR